jgi:general secretion pathway protein G
MTSVSRGFTLIELLVVMAVLGVLLSLAAPRYFDHVDRSREAVLRHNLAGLREAIDRFHADQARYPTELKELVDKRYIREIPLDPITDRADTWVLQPPPGQSNVVFEVRSGASGGPRGGEPYAQW